MATTEEIERRVEEADAARSARRAAAAKRVGDLAQRRAAIAEQLSDIERELRRAFSARGHDFRPIEPDFPQCKQNVDHADPQFFLLDLSSKPSHVREAAGYFADLKKYRQAPVFLVSADAADLSKVSFKVARAKHVKPKEAVTAVEAALGA